MQPAAGIFMRDQRGIALKVHTYMVVIAVSKPVQNPLHIVLKSIEQTGLEMLCKAMDPE